MESWTSALPSVECPVTSWASASTMVSARPGSAASWTRAAASTRCCFSESCSSCRSWWTGAWCCRGWTLPSPGKTCRSHRSTWPQSRDPFRTRVPESQGQAYISEKSLSAKWSWTLIVKKKKGPIRIPKFCITSEDHWPWHRWEESPNWGSLHGLQCWGGKSQSRRSSMPPDG